MVATVLLHLTAGLLIACSWALSNYALCCSCCNPFLGFGWDWVGGGFFLANSKPVKVKIVLSIASSNLALFEQFARRRAESKPELLKMLETEEPPA